MCKKMFALRTETNDTYEKDDLSENNGSSGNDDFLCIVEEEEQNNNLEVWGNFGGRFCYFQEPITYLLAKRYIFDGLLHNFGYD